MDVPMQGRDNAVKAKSEMMVVLNHMGQWSGQESRQTR
jgi:hypothetical protein